MSNSDWSLAHPSGPDARVTCSHWPDARPGRRKSIARQAFFVRAGRPASAHRALESITTARSRADWVTNGMEWSVTDADMAQLCGC